MNQEADVIGRPAPGTSAKSGRQWTLLTKRLSDHDQETDGMRFREYTRRPVQLELQKLSRNGMRPHFAYIAQTDDGAFSVLGDWPNPVATNREPTAFLKNLLDTQTNASAILNTDGSIHLGHLANATEEIRLKFLHRYPDRLIGEHLSSSEYPLGGTTLARDIKTRSEVLAGYISKFRPQEPVGHGIVAVQKEILSSLRRVGTPVTEELVRRLNARVYPVFSLGCVRGFFAVFDAGPVSAPGPEDPRHRKMVAAASRISKRLKTAGLECIDKVLDASPRDRPPLESMEAAVRTIYPHPLGGTQALGRMHAYRIPLSKSAGWELGSRHIKGHSFLPLLYRRGDSVQPRYYEDMISYRLCHWLDRVKSGWQVQQERAQEEERRRWRDELHVLTHHVGTIFKTIRISALASSGNSELQDLAAILSIAWGANNAITLVRKILQNPSYLADEIIDAPPRIEALVEAVGSIIALFSRASTWQWRINGAPLTHRPAVRLPLFLRDENSALSTTFTFGLSEIVFNISKYPQPTDGSSAQMAIGSLRDDERSVDVDVTLQTEPGTCTLQVKLAWPIFCLNEPTTSATVSRIRILEALLAQEVFGGRRVVATSELSVDRDRRFTVGHVYCATQTWAIDIESLRRFSHERR